MKYFQYKETFISKLHRDRCKSYTSCNNTQNTACDNFLFLKDVINIFCFLNCEGIWAWQHQRLKLSQKCTFFGYMSSLWSEGAPTEPYIHTLLVKFPFTYLQHYICTLFWKIYSLKNSSLLVEVP